MSDQFAICQTCGHSNLIRLLDLGYQPLCNEFWPADKPAKPQTFYPLCLRQCDRCRLVQIDHVIPTTQAFGSQYTYLTGSSQSLVNYYTELGSKLQEKFSLEPGDTVIELGSNDGTFLKVFQDLGMDILGVEGSSAAASAANQLDIPTLQQFFGSGVASTIRQKLRQGAKIRLILAMNVLAHTDNINDFLEEVSALMDEDTVFVSQSHWLIELIQKTEFDTIYHEHLRYYTLDSLMLLFQNHGLNISHAESNDFYGGSILVHATLDQSKPTSSSRTPEMQKILDQESKIDVAQSFSDMNDKIISNKSQLLKLLVDLKESGKQVVGIGAPMKASTFLNFYGITEDLVSYLAEVNPLKIGTVVPGVRIPVLSEEAFFHQQPDYAMLLSWNMAGFIIPKYRELGYRGKFILPVPELEIVE